MAKPPDSPFKRAGDPDDHDDQRAGLLGALGMGAVREPAPPNVRDDHAGPVHAPEVTGDPAAQLLDLLAHHRPPVTTHFVDGALDEHAHHEPHADGDAEDGDG